MAFVCTAGEFPPEAVEGEVVVPIGYDDQSPLTYSVLMGFAPIPGGDVEFYWVVIEANALDETEKPFWSGLETKGLFTKEDRVLIRSAVLQGIQVLLDARKPSRVFCCTHDSHLPEKALVKHLLIAASFEMCGYRVLRQPVQLGKHSWWMELQS